MKRPSISLMTLFTAIEEISFLGDLIKSFQKKKWVYNFE